MLKYLKKTWKLTLCNGLLIHLIGCNQVKNQHNGSTSTRNNNIDDPKLYIRNQVKQLVSKKLSAIHTCLYKRIGSFYTKNTEPTSLIIELKLALGLLKKNNINI